jgi:hypothetical protein
MVTPLLLKPEYSYLISENKIFLSLFKQNTNRLFMVIVKFNEKYVQ